MTSFCVGFHYVQSNLQKHLQTGLVIENLDSPLIPAGCLNKEEYEYPETKQDYSDLIMLSKISVVNDFGLSSGLPIARDQTTWVEIPRIRLRPNRTV